jgi:hypothetical protein
LKGETVAEEISEGQTAPAEQAAESTNGEQFDPNAVSLDELRDKIASEQAAEEAAPAPVEEAPIEEETPEEAPAGAEAETTEAPAEEEAPADAELSETDELRAMLEVQQAQSKHFESLLGRQAGEDGFFKRKYEQQQNEIAELRRQLQSGGVREELPTETYQPPAPQQAPVADSTTTYLVGKAMQDAGQEFLAENPDAIAKDEATGAQDLNPALKAALQAQQERINRSLTTNDPIRAASEVKALLSAAWAKVDLDRKKARLEEIHRKRFEQGKRLKERKRASASASPGKAKPTSTQRRVDLMTMPLEELRKLAEQQSSELERDG